MQNHPTVYLCSICLLFGLFSLQLKAQSCSAPAPIETTALLGDWTGYFSYNGELHPFQLAIKEDDSGLITHTSLTEINIQNATLTTWICASNEVHMRLDLRDQRIIKLIGSPANDQFSGRMVYYASPESNADREVFALKKERL